MNPMMYKGYAARVEYSDEDACFVGHIAGISDIVGFHADTVAGLKAAFSEAVDDYLATAVQLKRAPKKTLQRQADVALAAGSACTRRHVGRGNGQEHQCVGNRSAGPRHLIRYSIRQGFHPQDNSIASLSSPKSWVARPAFAACA